jgi:hypothetical protein
MENETQLKVPTDISHAPVWPHAVTDLPLVPVFAVGNVWYYRFPEGELPVGRAFAARAYYEELEMRCTREHLLAYCAAQRACLNKGDLVSAASLTAELQDRLDWVFAPDTVYKLAAVVYFDAGEDPNGFDFRHAAEKIRHWKAAEADFFVARPVRSLLPAFSFSEPDLKAYLQGIHLQELVQAANISAQLSSEALSETVRTWLNSHTATLSA